MRYLVLIAAIITLSFAAYAQPSGSPNPTAATKFAPPSTTDDVPTKSKFPPIKIGNVPVPPEKAYPITIPKIGQALVIDGKVDEEIWKDAAVFKDFVQTGPGDNIAPSKPTEVYVMYDEKHMYIAFKAWDEKDKIRASVAKRDNVTGEDNVRVWLDTYNDQRRAYVLAFNPFGIQQDGIYTEGNGADFSVDIVMESKGVIEEWGWSVEVKIPFKSLRYSAGKDKLWGFNLARNIDRFNDEFDAWLPDDRNVSGFLNKHGKITGLDGIKYERTLEVTPSVTVSETGKRVRTLDRFFLGQDENRHILDPGRWINQPVKADLGVTLKYSLSPNVTLDAAINPDFAEIEADAPVVTANQRFPIFFEEKRPFFLEGKDTFNSPLRIFDSRSIVDPDFAAKITGKTGKNTFGLLVASDNAPGNYDEDDRNDLGVRPRVDEFLDKNALFAILRLKRDFGKENHIGFFGTYRSFPEQKNLVAGVDGRIKINPQTTAIFQVVGTQSRRCFFDPVFEPTQNPDQSDRNQQICGGGTYGNVTVLGSQYNEYRSGNGLGYYVNVDHSTDTNGWFAEFGGRSADYRADAGFTRRTNSNFAFFFHRTSTKSNPKGKIIRLNWNKMGGVDYDWSGRIQSANAETRVNLSLQRSAFLNFGGGVAYEKLYEEEFGLKRSPTRPNGTFLGDPTRATSQHFLSMNFEQNLNKQIRYGFFLGTIGNAFDFFHFKPLPTDPDIFLQDPGPGRQIDFEGWAEYKPIDPLRMSVSYTKSRLVRNDNRVRAFDADLVSARSTYQFTRFLFTRLRLDYDSTRNNYSGQALLAFTPSPGKAFYIGYNDNSNYRGFNPYTGQFEPGFQRNSRTFFVRASYIFRKSI
ncbi:MAG: DUF5916 domain-containing protein [Pyrinomonadaceae bacterium]